MADQLTTALVNTNRFIVLERANLDTVMAEQDLVTSGRVSQSTGAAFGQIEGAELAVIASVTEYDDSANGATASSGGLLGDVFQSVSAGFSGSHMAIDLRLVDTRTSRILFATSVEGGNGEYDFTAAATKFGGSIVGGNLSAWSNTPQEKALREVIQKSVEIMLTRIPSKYYRYDQNNELGEGFSPEPVKVSQVQAPVRKVALSTSTDRPMTQYERQDLSLAQAQLHCLGYLEEDEENGRYTPATVQALERYQGHYNLPVNGQLTEKTFDSLNDSDCMSKSFSSGLNALAEAFGGGVKSSREENKRKLAEKDAAAKLNKKD